MEGKKVQPTDVITERLTDMEKKQMTVGPAITTTTFQRGDPIQAAAALKQKLAAVITANPWLAGNLIKKSGALNLCYSPSPQPVDQFFNMGTDVINKGGLDSEMEFVDVCKAVAGTAAEIGKGSALINNNKLLLALTVVPDAKRSSDTFAVIFSVSHVIADGYTYYKLLSMLAKDGEVVALNATRKHDIGPQSKLAMGKEEGAFLLSGSLICNVICSMMCGSKPLIESYHVDLEKVKAAKQAVQKEGPEGVDFVSTNDILTSAFGNATDCRVLLMPLNFRDRLPDFTGTDAGNYEGALALGPEDYAGPELIRKTMKSGPPTFKRCVAKPLPGCCESMRTNLGMITNWCFPFFEELQLEGCEQLLHMPHCDTNMVPFDIAVVYRPKKGKLALALFVRSCTSADLKADLPVGKLISSAESCV